MGQSKPVLPSVKRVEEVSERCCNVSNLISQTMCEKLYETNYIVFEIPK